MVLYIDRGLIKKDKEMEFDKVVVEAEKEKIETDPLGAFDSLKEFMNFNEQRLSEDGKKAKSFLDNLFGNNKKSETQVSIYLDDSDAYKYNYVDDEMKENIFKSFAIRVIKKYNVDNPYEVEFIDHINSVISRVFVTKLFVWYFEALDLFINKKTVIRGGINRKIRSFKLSDDVFAKVIRSKESIIEAFNVGLYGYITNKSITHMRADYRKLFDDSLKYFRNTMVNENIIKTINMISSMDENSDIEQINKNMIVIYAWLRDSTKMDDAGKIYYTGGTIAQFFVSYMDPVTEKFADIYSNTQTNI